MAHVILFTDRALLDHRWHDRNLSYPAGAYKIASVLREHGLDVLVVPSCLNLTFHGVTKIIQQNSKDLLWVGISTTLLATNFYDYTTYIRDWHTSKSDLADYNYDQSIDGKYNTLWAELEFKRLAAWCDRNMSVPLLIGGAYVTYSKFDPNKLHQNCFVIPGYAEDYVVDYTLARIKDPTLLPPDPGSNENYDNNAFKSSKIVWEHTDMVVSDAWLPLEVDRGCALNCNFCSYGRKDGFNTYKHPEILREELIRNYELFGTTKYVLLDDLYNDSPDKVKRLYDEVWSRLPFKPEWTSFMRLDMIWSNPDTADFIRESGARFASFGIESLHDLAARKVGKGLGRRRIIETLEILKEKWGNEVLSHGMFIAGLPHEPLESIKASVEWCHSSDLLFSFNFEPLLLISPDQMPHITPIGINDISANVTKYGVTWISKNVWQNDQGVRHDQVKILCHEINDRLPMNFKLSYWDYADMRATGISHQDVVNLRHPTTETNAMVDQCRQKTDQLLKDRLEKILNLNS
jgi:radical SAM superfamily enzyme YgiQ (UPF0313 family)